ncbi:MAG: hypothetical protein WAP03_25390 [Methylorubrum rhodinum]|uniref:hypothetical protein n=1 Tax=Methylorubrum rhodinum TaxID=29428 RepID=UPI003BB10357
MADSVTQHNIAALLSVRIAAALVAIVAGAGGDNGAVTGLSLDRVALKLPRSAALTIAFSATLAANATLALKGVKVQHRDEGGGWSDFATFADPGVVATGPVGGGTVHGQVTVPVDLDGARQHIRLVFTPDLSAANTDTVTIGAVAALGGFDRLPAAA